MTLASPAAERDTHRARETELSYLGQVPTEMRLPMLKILAMRSAERRIFGDAEIPEASLRILFPEFVVVHPTGRTLPLEVTAQIFPAGIILIAFKASVDMGGEGVSLSEFIDDHVNLSELELQQIHTDLEIGDVLNCANTAEEQGSRSRWSIFKDRVAFRRDLRRHMAEAVTADATRPRTILSPADSNHLSDLADLLVRTTTYVLRGPRPGAGFLLLSEPHHPRRTGRWHGSPHVHLVRFSGQTTSAARNEQLWKDAFRSIIARVVLSNRGPKTPLPESVRAFDDLGVYISEGVMLWVYTTGTGEMHLGEHKHSPAFDIPTYHNQVKGETIEYAYTLYTSILEELDSREVDWDRVLAIKERQLRFERELSLTGQFGEVRDLLREAFRARRFDELRLQAVSLIDLRESGASVAEERRLASTGVTIALIVSFLGLGNGVAFLRWAVKPHVPLLRDLHQPSFLESLVLGAIVLVFLSAVAWAVHIVLRRKKYLSWPTNIRR